MKKLFSTRTRAILIAAVILALLTAAGAVMARGDTPVLENVTRTVTAPLRGAAATVTRQMERIYNYLYGYETLEAENQMLRQRLAEVERAGAEAESYQREIARLQELLNLSAEHEDYKFVSSYLIGRDSSGWGDTLTLGKGSAAGIETGMCAVTEYGQVVGIVTEVGTNWSTVTTILDSSSEISAMLSSSGYTGVVQGLYQTGSADTLRMRYLPTDSVLKNGEQVVTVGSDRYPKGLVLGTITGAGLDETGVAKYAVLEPAAAFSALEQVFVITDYTHE